MVGKQYWFLVSTSLAKLRFAGCLLIFVLGISASHANSIEPQLDFDEIYNMSKDQYVQGETWLHLNRVLRTSFGEMDRSNDLDINDGSIRVTDWNIERGFALEQIKQLITKEQGLPEISNDKFAEKIREQIEVLKQTDIFILNEVDWGLPRTDYKNVAQEFADLFDANFVFVPEFIELSPDILDDPELDKEKYLGLHGNAIVSRFPIVKSSVLRLPQCYDWYDEEKKKIGLLEKSRRKGSDIVINEEVLTELRSGGRLAIISDISLPEGETVTVVATHLENRTKPACREKQLRSILNHIKTIANPVVLAGDLNNFEKSAEPVYLKTALQDKITDLGFMTRMGLNFINPYALITNSSRFVVDLFRKHQDPTVTNIPVILPNKTRKLFSMIEKFRFADALGFDLSGHKDWSYQGKESDARYSNSNQIANKGFVETFAFNRHFGIAKYKIDWIFVKPSLKADCKAKKKLDYECKNYFPAFGQTLKELNQYFKISDHNPVTVKLMF